MSDTGAVLESEKLLTVPYGDADNHLLNLKTTQLYCADVAGLNINLTDGVVVGIRHV